MLSSVLIPVNPSLSLNAHNVADIVWPLLTGTVWFNPVYHLSCYMLLMYPQIMPSFWCNVEISVDSCLYILFSTAQPCRTSNSVYLVDHQDSHAVSHIIPGIFISLESVHLFKPSGYLILMNMSLHFHQLVMLNRKTIKNFHLGWQRPLCQFHYILYYNVGGGRRSLMSSPVY